MKQYTYVTIQNEKFLDVSFTAHREIIDEYAAKGYRYIGFLPTVQNDYGKIKEIDLIFEKDSPITNDFLFTNARPMHVVGRRAFVKNHGVVFLRSKKNLPPITK